MENDVVPNNPPPPAYWVGVHLFSIFLPALAITFYFEYLASRLAPPAPPVFQPLVWTITFIIWIVTATVVLTLAYTLAGGFEKRTTSLSPTRFILFIFITGVYPGLMVGAFWLLIRSVLIQLFDLKDPAALGHLLRVRDIL